MLTSRERVLTALDHQEPDRVPIFFGVNSPTTMLAPAYEAFKSHLGIRAEPRLFSRAFQYCRIDEEVMERFGSDARPLLAGPPPSTLAQELGPDRFIDKWGINWYQAPGSIYYETTNAPLREATIADLDTYPWPDLAHPSRFVGLGEEARAMHEDTPHAVVALGYLSTFESCTLLRGLDTLLLDCAANPDFVHALMRRVTDLMIEGVIPYLEAVGDYIDLITMADDMGTQTSLLISPKMYRALVKPYQAELIAAVKERTKAKLMLHSCGNVYPLIGDYIDIGVDVLNPVQVSTPGLADTARLKREFGKNISFCGGIDTGHVLPRGSTDDVRAEVRRRIRDLAPGGGYVLAAVHCIQPDVPPENVVAMLEEAAIAGRYPLNL